MNNKNKNFNHLQDKVEKKYKKRKKRKERKMKVSGAEVKKLQQIITARSKGEKNK